MTTNMFIKDLIELGLGEKEAKAYITLLELEVATVQELAKVAKINRSSAYVTLESLQKKGLVSVSDDKKVRKYIATAPEAVLRSAEDKARKQENVRQKIEALVPEMKALYKGTKKKPLVRIYEGKQGLINIFEDSLRSKEKLIRVSSSPGNLGPIIYNYIPHFVAERFKRGVKMISIHPDDEMNRELKRKIPNNFDSITLVPEKSHNFSADFAIYDDKIGYMVKDNGGLGVIIESREMAEVMKSLFDLAHKEAERLANKKARK
jgi:sugar-specific transcriptional regulator TrmB